MQRAACTVRSTCDRNHIQHERGLEDDTRPAGEKRPRRRQKRASALFSRSLSKNAALPAESWPSGSLISAQSKTRSIGSRYGSGLRLGAVQTKLTQDGPDDAPSSRGGRHAREETGAKKVGDSTGQENRVRVRPDQTRTHSTISPNGRTFPGAKRIHFLSLSLSLSSKPFSPVEVKREIFFSNALSRSRLSRGGRGRRLVIDEAAKALDRRVGSIAPLHFGYIVALVPAYERKSWRVR